MFIFRCHRLLVLASALLWAPLASAQYSEQQFEAALQGYLLLAHDDVAVAAQRLYQIGKELESTGLLRDATHAAIRINDVKLAETAGSRWYAAGGGVEALELLTRIKVSYAGLEAVSGLLRRLAEETRPQLVYAIIRSSTQPSPATIEAMRASHPLHLRKGDYSAYLALLMLTINDVERARSMLIEVRANEPANTNILMVSLLIADLTKNKAEAVTLLRKLAAASATNLGAAAMAYLVWKEGISDPERPITVPADFAQAQTQNPRALLLAGSFLLHHDAPREALEIFKSVPRQAPEWNNAVLSQVNAYRVLDDGHHADILALLDKELRSAPAEHKPNLALAYAAQLGHQDGYAAAFKYLSGFSSVGDDLNVLFRLSLYAERSGNMAAAEAALQRYIMLAPASADGYNGLSYLYAVNDYKIPQAITLINHALSIDPNSPAIIDTHAWVLFRTGEYELALTRLQLAVSMLSEPNAEILAHLGEILWALGRHDEAKIAWRNALAADAEDYFLQKTLARYADQFDLTTH